MATIAQAPWAAVAVLGVVFFASAGPAPAAGERDLAAIRASRVIRFLVPADLGYLPRVRDPRGAEQELARAFAARIAVTAEFVPVATYDELIPRLEAGDGDVVAAAMTVTAARAARIAFTRPLRFVEQVVVARAGDDTVRTVEDLAGRTIAVRGSSSYAETLRVLSTRLPGLNVTLAPEGDSTFDLIQRVARGEVPLTVADSDILEAAREFEPGVHAAATLAARDAIAWGVRRGAGDLKAALDAFLVERALTAHRDDVYAADLDGIKERRVLRVATRNNSTCFFVHRGEALGFEYELARAFAEHLGVRLEMVIAPDREALLRWLDEGRADMVAASLSITPERARRYAFSEPYNLVQELLVVTPADTTTKGLADLRGSKVSVRRSSGYYETLSARREQYGYEIETLPEDMETEDVLHDVDEGRIAATVADSNIVDVELTYSAAIRVVGPIGDPVRTAWALRHDQPRLKAAADAFVKKTYRGTLYNVLLKKYFKDKRQMRVASSDARTDLGGRISPYDALVRKFARRSELDWRLVSAQMYQESRFDPKARSWVGAVGLMQVMPATAKDLKVTDLTDDAQNVDAGVRLLARYARMFEGERLEDKHRLRFALAAYNSGPGHVFDARRLARERGLDPDRWFGHVEQAMLLLSRPAFARRARHGYCRCDEPVRYVSQIQSRYDTYARLVPLE